jgi:DNA replication and repair protein RecF
MYRYRRVLAQRNALLKKLGFLSIPLAQKKEQLSVWNHQLIAYGSRILEKRLAFLVKMAPMARLTQRKITDGKENMELGYLHYAQKYVPAQTEGALASVTSSSSTAEIGAYLQRACEGALEDDLRFGATQWGPHRDDLQILLDGAEVRQFGSQGQQRTSVLALKLAELEVFRGESGEYPVLLLDDVLSELDESRQKQLLSLIGEKAIQCIITATEDRNGGFMGQRERKRFFVKQGGLYESG